MSSRTTLSYSCSRSCCSVARSAIAIGLLPYRDYHTWLGIARLTQTVPPSYRDARYGRKLPLLIFPGITGPPHDLLQTTGLRPVRLSEVLVNLVAITHLRPGIADQLPADQSGIAAVHGVAK